MDAKSFCRSMLWKWLPQASTVRRLSGLRGQSPAPAAVVKKTDELSDEERLIIQWGQQTGAFLESGRT